VLHLHAGIGLLIATLCPLALGQAQPAKKPTASSPPPVTIVKTDGTSIRGQISTSDPDSITIQPAAKPGADAASPVVIEWKDIRSVSSGLTQQKALAAWKEQHAGQLCDTCHGDRTVFCPTCKGTGHDPASGANCKTCNGALVVECKTPKCKDGKIPCQRQCLKRSEGQWVQHEGKTVRFFGRSWVSEAHVGELYSIDKQTGQLSLQGKCPTCDGTGVVFDPTCAGTGKMPCKECASRKGAPACPANCSAGRVPCNTCEGTGLKKS
jgi:hypothetical protein